MHDLGTTLVGVATPPGRGGIGCIRISGSRSREIAERLFRPVTRAPAAPDGPPAFGRFLGRDGDPIDHGFLVLFSERRSYTGEPSSELWVHGSPSVLAELVAAAIAAGAAPAGPGEFTYRALRAGKIDLARAEAIRDLIAARTIYQARVAFAQAEGALSRRLGGLKEGLTEWIARGEAAVEFVEEADVHLGRGDLLRGIERLTEEAAALLDGYSTGRVVRDGATVAFVGLPNVGKSSLFNRMLARERAIVSPEPGTTRDTLEETIDLEGAPVRLVDTAGLREIDDPVEGEGVRRARRAREDADLVLLILDAGRPVEAEERSALDQIDTERTIAVLNKSDLPGAEATPLPSPGAFRVSALTGDGLVELRQKIRELLLGAPGLENPILTDARHARALERTIEHLARAREAAVSGIPEELVLEDLRSAMRELGVITGEVGNEDLYARIFSTFCIGK